MASSSNLIVLLIVTAMLLIQVSGFPFGDEPLGNSRERRPSVRLGARKEGRPRFRLGARKEGVCFNFFNDYICGEVIRADLDCVLNGKKRLNKFAQRFCRRLCGYC